MIGWRAPKHCNEPGVDLTRVFAASYELAVPVVADRRPFTAPLPAAQGADDGARGTGSAGQTARPPTRGAVGGQVRRRRPAALTRRPDQ